MKIVGCLRECFCSRQIYLVPCVTIIRLLLFIGARKTRQTEGVFKQSRGTTVSGCFSRRKNRRRNGQIEWDRQWRKCKVAIGRTCFFPLPSCKAPSWDMCAQSRFWWRGCKSPSSLEINPRVSLKSIAKQLLFNLIGGRWRPDSSRRKPWGTSWWSCIEVAF